MDQKYPKNYLLGNQFPISQYFIDWQEYIDFYLLPKYMELARWFQLGKYARIRECIRNGIK